MDPLQRALSLHQQGMFDAAQDAYQAVLKRSPRDINALNFLGILCFQRGKIQEGVKYLRKCLQIRPDFAQAHNNLGNGLMQTGSLKEAIQSFTRAVSLDPRYAEAHLNLASAYGRQKDFERARLHASRAVELNPGVALGWAALASALHGLSHFDEAIEAAEKAVHLAPGLPEAELVMARVLWQRDKRLDAVACYRKAIGAFIDDRDCLFEFGSRLVEVGRSDEALPYLKRLAEMAPKDVDALIWLAAAHKNFYQEDLAETVLRRVVELAPERIDIHLDLADVLQRQKNYTEAEAHLMRALAIDPESMAASFQLAGLLSEMDRLDEAQAYLDELLQKYPDSTDLLSVALFHSNYSAIYPPERCLQLANAYGRVVSTRAEAPNTTWLVDQCPKRLKVGLVSGDILDHPVGRFLENVLPRIDKERVELIAYPTHRDISDLSLRLMPHLSAWKPLSGMTDRDAAEMIRADGVHVLIDLSGHTAHNRLPMFAWRPAPVQISWLGYFATTGVAEIDYFVADAASVPAEIECQFSERIWRLPDTRLCFSPPGDAGAVAALPALSSGHITFGCFQNLKKLQEPVLKAWAQILDRLPTARLRVQTLQFADASVVASFCQRFVAAGGDVDRLIPCGPSERKGYLAAHQEVDIILDTFPFPGGATTCEALWMGVPTLSLAGGTLIARQGASILSAAGAPEWIAENVPAYVDKACAFAMDLPALAALRGSLRDRVAVSSLFDGDRFARNLERALWQMWEGG